MLEVEIKLAVRDIVSTLEKLRQIAQFSHTQYIRDVIYGDGNKKKIRLRFKDEFEKLTVEAIYKYKVQSGNGTKKEIEKEIYIGNSKEEALKAILAEGDFKEENSYEKIRILFFHPKVEIALDIYPFGVWLEIEGRAKDIWGVARKLGFSRTDAVNLNADECYLEWNKTKGWDELWDVRFGFFKT